MKNLFYASLLIFITLITFNCQKEISYDLPGGNNGGSSPITGTLQGNIIDENGQPAAGVIIRVGSKTATTNAKGYFRITGAALDRNASHVTAEKAGYFTAHRSFCATPGVNQVMIKLIPKVLAGTINATAGGEVTLSNGSKVQLPANGVVSGSSSYTGTINVYAAYIDPTAADIAERVPGSFMADDKNGRRVSLESYGMMAVELESTSGNKLQIATGKTATLTTPIPASTLASAPASISLWYVDEQTGIWKEEGVATKSGNSYVGEVKHFSFWNCDISIPAVTLTLTLKNSHGDPIVHGLVRISRQNTGWSTAYGYTDSLGQVSGLVPANENLVLDVLDPCHNSIFTQNISPLTQNTNLGNITVTSAGSSLLTIEGRLLNCSSAPVTNGFAIIYFNNSVRHAATNSSGDFSVSFIVCSTSGSQIEITGVDNAAQVQSSSVLVPVTTPTTNAGNITACGVSAEQYINYTLNGTNYSINSTASDSLMAGTWQQGAVPFYTLIAGMAIANNNYFDLSFISNTQTTGTYAVDYLNVHNFQRIGLISPFNVNVTSFPTTPGGFYEGNFSGQFRDSVNLAPLHTINGTFRIRR